MSKATTSTESTQLSAEDAANINNHLSGHRSWGQLTINWHMNAAFPLVQFEVTLKGTLIGIGYIDPRAQITPLTYSFRGAVGHGISQVSASGTLTLDLGKKDVTFDIKVISTLILTAKGILFTY